VYTLKTPGPKIRALGFSNDWRRKNPKSNRRSFDSLRSLRMTVA